MELMNFYYPVFTPPKEVSTRVHRIGFDGHQRYTEPKVKPARPKRDENEPCPSEERLLKVLKRKAKPMTSKELAPLMKMTPNHTGILLTSLFKKGKLDRMQYRKPGTRFYRYTVKEV